MRRTPSVFLILAGVVVAIASGACSKADAAARAAGATSATAVAATTSGALPQGSATNVPSAGGPAGDPLPDSVMISRADRGRLMGRDSGAIWVVMISDFQCPYCKQWHDAVLADVQRDYVNTGKVRMAYLNLPLPQHKYARAEAEASMCAAVQNKFWPYAEALFKRQEAIGKLPAIQPELESIARGTALDLPSFTACQGRQAIRALVESDIAQASKAGVRSTPSFLVGDFLVEGSVPYADFRKAIDTALVMARAKRTR
jgi:protein-disulfide isomerase